VLLGKPAEKSEIAFPRGLAGDVFDQVASEPIVMHAHSFELGCPLMIEPRLPRLAPAGLVGMSLMPAAAASAMIASTLLRVTGSSSARSWIG